MSLFSSNPQDNFEALKDANFYFYFDKDSRTVAEKFKKLFTAQGYNARLNWLEFGNGQWSLVLNKAVASFEAGLQLDADFRTIADKLGLNYDGHEIEI